jgi:uncharacterized protein (TIGR02677 family)
MQAIVDRLIDVSETGTLQRRGDAGDGVHRLTPSPTRVFNQVDALRYVTAPNAPAYRAIMQVFADAMAHYVIELRPWEVLRSLADAGYDSSITDADQLEVDYLDQLVTWGNLAFNRDPAGVARLEDYYRKKRVYRLTDVGEAAHRAVAEVEATVGRSGSLQTNMLVKIRDGLDALARTAAHADAEQLLRLLHDVYSAFDTLTHEANRFMTDLGRITSADRDESTDERFAAFKHAVLAYISRFVEQLRRLRDQIVTSLDRVAGLRIGNSHGIDAVIEVASTSDDLPDFEGDGRARLRWAAEQRAKWNGITGWFAGTGDQPTVERLADFAVGAVLTLTRTLGRLNDRRGRPVDRAADLLTLARWFAACPTDDDAHALWHVAFGLGSARHVHLAEEDPELTSTRTSWWDATPVEVPTRLRTSGTVARPGPTPRAADYTAQRRWLAARARRERAQTEAALVRFADRDTRLSTLERLDDDELVMLLDLLDTALASPRGRDGARRCRTSDGRLEIILHAPRDEATCALRMPSGRLRCPDYLVTVVDLARTAAQRDSA